MLQYKCSYGPKYVHVVADDSMDAADQSWIQLCAPHPFAVDVRPLERLPLLSPDIAGDPGDEDDGEGDEEVTEPNGVTIALGECEFCTGLCEVCLCDTNTSW